MTAVNLFPQAFAIAFAISGNPALNFLGIPVLPQSIRTWRVSRAPAGYWKLRRKQSPNPTW
jgi:hypothetical protein